MYDLRRKLIGCDAGLADESTTHKYEIKNATL